MSTTPTNDPFTGPLGNFPKNKGQTRIFNQAGLMRPMSFVVGGKTYIDPEAPITRINFSDITTQAYRLPSVGGVGIDITRVRTEVHTKKRQINSYFFDRTNLRWTIISTTLPEGTPFVQGANPVGFHANTTRRYRLTTKQSQTLVNPNLCSTTDVEVQLIPRHSRLNNAYWFGTELGSFVEEVFVSGPSTLDATENDTAKVTACPHNRDGRDITGLCKGTGIAEKWANGATNPRTNTSRATTTQVSVGGGVTIAGGAG